MSNHTGLGPKNPLKYIGPNITIETVVTRNRAPTSADYRQPENGKLYPFATLWLVGKDPTTGVQGDLWYLSKIASNIAYWLKLSSGGSGPLIEIGVDAFTAPGTNPVVADAGGLITITGAQVATGVVGTNVIRTDSLAANDFTIEIQRSTAVSSTDVTKNGVSHFNSNHFSVDGNAFVSLLGGGQAIDSVIVDTFTAPGTNPVIPNLSGEITVTGGQVAAGTTANVIRTDSLAANTYTIQIQRSQAVASTTIGDNGVSHYNSAHFTVDANGFVSLSNATADINIIATQVFTSNGTYTPTAGMAYCTVTCVGGGSGGAGVGAAAAGQNAVGSGGGGGGTSIKTFSAATIGVSQAVTIGAGGNAGASGGGNGGAGGTSSFGALISATGGGASGFLPSAASNVLAGGGAGIGIGGDLNITGSPGGTAIGIGAFAVTGFGGSSYLGGSGQGIAVSGAHAGTGLSGGAYGAGGSGGATTDGGAGAAGGAGSDGVIYIVEYIST